MAVGYFSVIDNCESRVSPFEWLDERKKLKRRYGYLDQELKKTIKANEKINVLFNVNFPKNCYGITALQYSPMGDVIGAGCGDGCIRLVTNSTGTTFSTITVDNNGGEITSIKFVETNPDYFVTSTQTGKICVCDVNSLKSNLFCIEKNNKIFSLDISLHDGWLISGGSDATVRLYDGKTKKLIRRYGGREQSHRMKIKCVKFDPKSPNMVATGGWDNSVKLWDLRSDELDPVRTFKGPQIHGDAIDFNDEEMLTGSCTLINGLYIWDLGTGKLINNIRLANVLSSLEGEYYSCVKYCDSQRRGNLILAAGRGRCALDVIDVKQSKILGSVRMKKYVKTLDCKNFIVLGGCEPLLKIVELPLEYDGNDMV